MDNLYASSYFDIDDILTEGQKIPCTFTCEVPGFGLLEGAGHKNIRSGATIELPVWLAKPLISLQNCVETYWPEQYRENVRNAIYADPKSISLLELSPYYYSFSEKLLDFWNDEKFVTLLLETLRSRLCLALDYANKKDISYASRTAFVDGLDSLERRYYLFAYQSLKAFKQWTETPFY